MRRRIFLHLAAAVLATPGTALAQAGKRYRVGCLYLAGEPSVRPFQNAFVDGMRALGYVSGRNLVVDVRYAGGDSGRLPALVDELIALGPDVLFGIEAVAVAMRTRTKTIPIVVPAGVDLVAAGLVKSLARPETNVTGISNLGDQLTGKHVELLAEIVPKISRVALLNDPLAPSAPRFEQFARQAAETKRIALVVAGAADPEAVRLAFAEFERQGAQGLIVVATGQMNHLRNEILSHVRRLRLPSVSGMPAAAWAEPGGLATYGTSFLENFRYAARYVDRILKGAKPSDLPVEQPMRFEFVLNLKAAREIGLKVPQVIVLRADRIIE